MSHFRTILNFCLVLLFTGQISAQEARLLRFPAIHDQQVVFTYAGDLYTVPLSGGMARKLTSHVGFEMFARFSPDGKTIAFTGQYDGNTEVFTIPAQGGVPQRLTHTATLSRDDLSDRMGPNNIVMTWTPDGKNVVYRSRKQTFNDFVGHLFSVPAGGGLSQELPLSTGGFCSYSPDGKQLAFNRVFREFRTWKYYHGGMADDIWIFNFDTKEVKNITNNIGQDIFPMWIGHEIFFLSDRDRTMNIFSYNLETEKVEKVTHFDDFDIKFPSHGGNSIVFEKGGYLFHFDASTREVKQIPVTIATDNQYSRSEYKDASKRIFGSDIAPDGSRVVFSARGDIFTVPAESGITRNLTRSSGAHDRSASWSPDGKHIAYVSDASGEYEIYIQPQDGSGIPIQLTQNGKTYIFSISWSPDSKKIAWSSRDGKLQYIDVQSKKITQVEKGEYDITFSYSWSPDSKWLTYTMQDENRFAVVYIYNLATGEKHPVTDSWYSSAQPSFSSDGKYLLFTSDRDFNPIYSRTEWNHAYSSMSRIYMVMLAKDTPSPFAPENNEVKIEEEKPKGKGGDEKKTEDVKSVDVKIDMEGLQQRTVAVPVDVANYWNVQCVDNKIYYMQMGQMGRRGSTKLYDLKKKTEVDLGEGFGFSISANNKKMLVSKGGQYAVIDLPSSAIKMEKTMDLSDMKMWVDYSEEWKQIFDESWRQMRDFFYVKNMHGVDWKAMHDKYEVLVPYVNHRADLTYIIGEMIGELNIGHAYVNSGEMPSPDRVKLGLLGAKISKHSSGFFKIDRLLEGAPWSRDIRSPLLDVGVNVSTGDYILAVDGCDLKDIGDIYQTLIGKADRTVELVVNSKPEMAGSRKVLVKPIADESPLYYYSWVQNNIRKVSEATNGEVGYIHIPDMGVEGLNEFVKYFYPQLNKKGLIIDDRGNGGGNVSPMILERLSRVPYRAKMRRGIDHPSPIPDQTHIGPKVLLLDRYSASDGDLFPYGFRQLGLGPIIGTRSWGGVVGIWGSLPFVDGADLRKPESASYSSETGDWIIEGWGVDPDIVIDNDPYKEYLGIDDQLNKAIEVIKENLKDRKGLPPVPKGPDKSK